MKQLASKAVWLFFFNYLLAVIFLIFTLNLLIMVPIFATTEQNKISDAVFGFLIFNIILFLILFLFAYVWAKLSYTRYKYELTEDGFKKEMGVIWKKYVTIPYERIQNVDIYRGLLARILGLSDLQIQTAGMSAPYSRGFFGGGAEGRLPGLSPQDAEKLRDELIKRARGKTTNQGL